MAKGHKRLTEAVEEYVAHRRARFAETTVANEAFLLRRFADHIGDIQLRHLRAERVTDWFYGKRGLLARHGTRDGLMRDPIKPSTHNYYRTRLNSFFRFCVTRGWLRDDLLRDIQPMKVPAVRRQQPSATKLLAMLDLAGSRRDRAYLAVAINTALRTNEITRLRLGDVDLEAGVLRVQITKSHEIDDVPITMDLDQELRRWLVAYEAAVDRPLRRDDYLIPARKGSVYRWERERDGTKQRARTSHELKPEHPVKHTERIVQGVLAQLGLPTKHEGTHTIRRAVARHFFDSMTSEVGYDAALRTVSALLHHKSSATTELYLGLSSERKRRDERLRGKPFLNAIVESDKVVRLRSS